MEAGTTSARPVKELGSMEGLIFLFPLARASENSWFAWEE